MYVSWSNHWNSNFKNSLAEARNNELENKLKGKVVLVREIDVDKKVRKLEMELKDNSYQLQKTKAELKEVNRCIEKLKVGLAKMNQSFESWKGQQD